MGYNLSLGLKAPDISCGFQTQKHRDFPCAQWLRLQPSNAGGAGLAPGWGTKIPHALWTKTQNTKEKQYCNTFSKDLK